MKEIIPIKGIFCLFVFKGKCYPENTVIKNMVLSELFAILGLASLYNTNKNNKNGGDILCAKYTYLNTD